MINMKRLYRDAFFSHSLHSHCRSWSSVPIISYENKFFSAWSFTLTKCEYNKTVYIPSDLHAQTKQKMSARVRTAWRKLIQRKPNCQFYNIIIMIFSHCSLQSGFFCGNDINVRLKATLPIWKRSDTDPI